MYNHVCSYITMYVQSQTLGVDMCEVAVIKLSLNKVLPVVLSCAEQFFPRISFVA